jgi:hypothetical protein
VKQGYAPGALFGAEIIRSCDRRPSGASYPCLAPGEVPYDFNGDRKPDTEAQALAFLANVPRSGSNVGVTALNPIQIDQTPENGDPLDHYLGKPFPDWSGSFGGTLTLFRNWRLNTLFEYRAGDFTVTNMTTAFKNALTIALNSERTANLDSKLQNPATPAQERLAAALEWANEVKALTPYDGLNQNEKGDFLRWRELGITYTAPQSLANRIRASSLSFTLTGRNLALITGYGGVDPESNQAGRGNGTSTFDNNFAESIDVFGLPLQRRFSFAVHLGY